MLKAATITKSFSWLTALTASIVLTCGCAPTGSPERTPVPEPSPSTSQGVETPAPYTPPAKPYAEMSQEELFAEADKVYRRANFILSLVLEEPSQNDVDDELSTLLTPNIAKGFDDLINKRREQGERLLNGKNIPIRTAPLDTHLAFPDGKTSLISALEACRDGRSIQIVNAQAQVLGNGVIVYDKVGFVIEEGCLKIRRYHSEKVSTCPIS